MAVSTPTFFQGLSDDDRAQLLEPLERRQFAAGATVLAEGDSPREIYVVDSGSADVYIADRQGGEHRVGQIGPGATVGEMSLFTGQPASASVRATTELDVLVMSEGEFQRSAAAFPRIYQNLGAILSQRLARSNRHSVQHEHGTVIALQDCGAPPLLSYALACSVAWHTRKPVLLVLLADSPPGDLAPFIDPAGALAGSSRRPGDLAAFATRPGAGERRAYVLVAFPEGPFAPALLEGTVDDLAHHYGTVLVLGPAAAQPNLPDRAIRLAAADTALAKPESAAPGHTIRGWTGTGRAPRPDQAGILRVPPLVAADEDSLRSGLLPNATPAGRALGWAARDIAGLKVGLTLGAGSVKGYAHYGVLSVLERLGLQADYVTGTSIGAIIAATYALGQGADEAARIMAETSKRAFRPTIPTRSLLSNAGVHHNFRMLAGDRRIEDLDIPLAVVAADLLTGQEVIFRRGLLRTAVLASMSIPGIYPPVRIGPYALVDGGILNPVPSDIAAGMGADVVIAVNLGSWQAQPPVEAGSDEVSGRAPWLLPVILRSVEIMQCKIGSVPSGAATIVVEPSFKSIASLGIRSFTQGARYIELGKQAAEAALPRIAASLPWLRA